MKSIRKNIKQIVKGIADAIYPKTCPFCDRIIKREQDICVECYSKLRYIEEPYCKKCGKQLHKQEVEYCYDCATSIHIYKKGMAVFAYNDKELRELEETHKGWERVRFKGLGELSAEDVKDSMLHPDNRRLEVLTIEDFEEAAESLNMLMGTKVDPRREFLFENVDFSVLNG